MPLVSVIIPTFNRRVLVGEAIASVLAQRGADFELIVVDDGSTDGTEVTLEPLRPRLQLLRQPNRGVSAARNTGARAARGDWLAFLDSDDLWLPGKLSLQTEFVGDHPDTRICQTGEFWIRNGVRVNPCRHHAKPSGDVFLPSLRRCLVSPSAVMIRRDLFDAVGGFDESLPACEDYDLWLRLSWRTAVPLIERPLVVKRGGHADQLSRRHWGMDRFRVRSLRRLLAEPGLSGAQRDAARAVLAEKCAILAQGAAKRGRSDEARRYRELALPSGLDGTGGRAAEAHG